MALTKGTNSYVSLAEADSYFSDRLDVAAWEIASETQKQQSLITATNILDTLDWVGIISSESQLLAFPRTGSYFDPKFGYEVVLKDDVPYRIISAVYEIAYHLLNNDGLLDSTGNVSSLSIGNITLNNIRSAGRIPNSAQKLINPLLQSRGQHSWWRAN